MNAEAERGSARVCRTDAEAALAAVVEQVVDRLAPRAEAILVREPLQDAQCPATSDLDFLVVGGADDLVAERLALVGAARATPRIDVLWLKSATLDDPEKFARTGLNPHRLLRSRLVYDCTGRGTTWCDDVAARMYQPQVQLPRLTGLLHFGHDTVREIGVTWDFPGLALFWLHMSHAACLAAVLDGARELCPNVYTRPFAYVNEIQEHTGLTLEADLCETLHLGRTLAPLIERLRRIHRLVAADFPEPPWPECMRPSTRAEYRYFLAEDELDWRIGVAEEMARQGQPWAGVFYLRFWAFMLARVPMVYHRALEGGNVHFVRPECAVRPDLEKHCPAILDDLTAIFGDPTLAQVHASLARVLELRTTVLDLLRQRGLELIDLLPWKPYERPARPVESNK